jgi:uncharacterized protein (DUF2164 family)
MYKYRRDMKRMVTLTAVLLAVNIGVGGVMFYDQRKLRDPIKHIEERYDAIEARLDGIERLLQRHNDAHDS